MIKENQRILNRTLLVLDGIFIVFAFLFSWFVRMKSGLIDNEGGYLNFDKYLIPILIAVPIYLIIYYYMRLYSTSRINNQYEEFIKILKSNFIGLILFIVILFINKEIDYSRILLGIFFVSNSLFVTVERLLVRSILKRIRKKGYAKKNILIIGYSDLAKEFKRICDDNIQWGYNIVGLADDNLVIGTIKDNMKVICRIDELEGFLGNNYADEVFITLDVKEYDKLKYIIDVCEKTGLKIQIIPSYKKYIPSRPYVEEVEGMPIINIRYVPLDNLFNKLIKRMFDIVVSSICILIFSPILILVAIIIKLTSKGNIIFKQERVGLNRRNFNMYKFRSMKIQDKEVEKSEWTTENDPRKTRVGNFIRKTSIDELPQLFNVLKGDMSLIGPRPERPYFVEKFKEEIPKYMVKHQVRPGMTGWAQVNGWRGNTSIEKRIEFDIYYIENWSIILDFKIIMMTVVKGFINDNAY